MLLYPLRAFISVCSLPVFYQRYTSGMLEVCLNLAHLRDVSFAPTILNKYSAQYSGLIE
jgi:hypothetical protein